MEDDLTATKRILREIAERQERIEALLTSLSERQDRTEELLAAHIAEVKERREYKRRVVGNLSKEMERIRLESANARERAKSTPASEPTT